MAKENKHKVKTNDISSPKYTSSDNNDDSDDDAPFPNGLNEKRVIKKLEKEFVAQDQLLEDQEDLLEQERKNTCELKRLLKLEKDKNGELAHELAKGKKTISSLEDSIGALQDSYDVMQKTYKDFEVQFDDLWVSTPNLQAHPKLLKDPLAIVVKNAIILILMLFMLKANNKILSKLL
jgi:hypothetical protein